MFAVEGLVNTSKPCALAIPTTIFVVVDFPAVPVITTKPLGKDSNALYTRFGASLLRTNPGKAEPPPGLTNLTANLSKRPIRIAGR
jgi:hypothetical protein